MQSYISIVKKNFFFLLLILLSYLILPYQNTANGSNLDFNHITSSCTIFTCTIGDTVYFGNNEDYILENTYLWYVPNQTIITNAAGNKDIYSAVFLGFDNNDDYNVDTYAQGGMNEFGLCFDANGLPSITLEEDGLYPYTRHALAQVLWECKNVSEVITWYQGHTLGTMAGQIHYADSTGDAVVVSANATGHWAFTRINTTFLVSTNFNLANNDNGWYPCTRYDTATQMLGEISSEDDLTVSACASVLYAVRSVGDYGTKYSNIFNPVNLDIYFNHGNRFSEQVKIDLMDKFTDLESFDQEGYFMGVNGLVGHVLVKTEEINALFMTNGIGFNIGISIGIIGGSILVFFIIRKIRKKTHG